MMGLKRPMLEKDARWLHKFNGDELKILVNIGFCKPKYYKPEVWRKAKRVMGIACYLGLAEPFDYGRGNGKYYSDLDNSGVLDGLLEARYLYCKYNGRCD